MFKSQFSKNVLTLVTGTTLAQAISIAISPVLTRLYTPEEFGTLSLYTSIVSFFFLISTGRYELAILLPKKKSDALNLILLTLSINVIFSFFVFLIIYFYSVEIALFLGDPELSEWLYFVPFSIVFTGFFQALYYWNLRLSYYTKISANKVIQTVSKAGTSLLASSASFNGMILAYIFAQVIAIYDLLRKSKLNYKAVDKLNMLRVVALAKKYKKLPLYSLPNSLLDGVRLLGINLCISKLFTMSILGQFSLAWKMLQLPSTLIGGALSQVFIQEASKMDRNKLYLFTKSFIIRMALIAMPAFILLYLYSEILFAVFFGENWFVAGQIASVLSPWLFLNFISSPIANVLIITNMQHISLLAAILYMVVPLTLLVVYQSSDFINILGVISISMSLILLFYIVISLFFLRKFSEC